MTKAFFFFLAFAISGCQSNKGPSTDPQQNRFYSVYKEIYTGWGKIPLDSTQQKLGAYLQEFPENAEAQMMMGNILYAKADFEKAISRYRKAISLQPQQPVFYSAMGSAFNVQNQIDSAEKYFLKGISLRDSSAYTFMNLASLYLKKQDRQKSFSFADSALGKANSSPLIYSGISYIFYQWKEEKKSRELFEQAVEFGLEDTSGFKEVLEGKMKLENYYRTNYQR